MKELFALYLTFASPVGDVELFVKELPNCENASVIADEEYAKNRGIDRNQAIEELDTFVLDGSHHLARQRLMKGVTT